MGIDVLTGLLDEKVVRIISLFARYPEKRFYLSEVSKLSKVNAASTFRVLNKLVKEEIVSATIIGKVRVYQMSRSERAKSLSQFLKLDSVEEKDPLNLFSKKVGTFPHINKIILDSKTSNSAKLIIVDDFSSKERIERVCEEIYEKHKFRISFVELKPGQFEGLRGSNMINVSKILFNKN